MNSRNFWMILMILGHALPVVALPQDDPGANPQSEMVIDRSDYDPENPFFQNFDSAWALGFRFAIRGVPIPEALGTTFQVFAEYHLPWQSMGVFSLGPHIGTFPLYVPEVGLENQYSNALAGAAVRYQFKFSKNPVLVPMLALEWEYYRIRSSESFSTDISGTDWGMSAGIMLNLNLFDPKTARDAYDSLGMLRSYLTMEVRSANLDNELFSLSGNYWLWGFRVEFE